MIWRLGEHEVVILGQMIHTVALSSIEEGAGRYLGAKGLEGLVNVIFDGVAQRRQSVLGPEVEVDQFLRRVDTLRRVR